MGVEDAGDAGQPDHDAGLPVTGEQDAERAGFEMEPGGGGPVRQRVEDHHHVELSGLQSVRSVATTADTSRPSGIEHRDVERQNRTIPLSRYSLLVLDKDIVDDHTESWAAHDIEVRSGELATNVTEVWPHGSPALGTPRLDTSGRGPALVVVDVETAGAISGADERAVEIAIARLNLAGKTTRAPSWGGRELDRHEDPSAL